MKTIYYNGRIYTGTLPLQQAFAVENGKFLFAGSDHDTLSLAGSGDSLVDLGGRFVCSGFNDSHMHLLSYGKALQAARLAEHTQSLKELVSYMAQFLKIIR